MTHFRTGSCSRPSSALTSFPREAEVYGSAFWLAYLANALTMTAVSMLVRYADFVTFLGGGEGQLGLIVGVGMVGSMLMRLAQGVGIDRHGSRRIWLWSLALFIVSLVVHLWIARVDAPGIYLARVLMQTSIAGIFGASITSISRRVPPDRMAEIVATLGTSGFLGVLVGPQLSDWICGQGLIGRIQLDRLFLSAAFLSSLAFGAAWIATRGELRPGRLRRPRLLALMARYNPGVVMLVAVAVGVALTIPNTFLRTFAIERGIATIGGFFAVYALSAFAVRLLTRRMFARYGNRLWVLIGLVSLTISMGLYLVVHQAWQLAIPGAVAGGAHALLFPSVVASGSTCFPERHRGLGTTLMLAMFDLGSLLGAPLVGGILLAARRVAVPAYPTMFFSMLAMLMLVIVIYWRWSTPCSAPQRATLAADVPRPGMTAPTRGWLAEPGLTAGHRTAVQSAANER